MQWREVYTHAINVLNDESAVTIDEALVISFAELSLNLVILASKAEVKNEAVSFLSSSIVPGFSYVPVVNVHTLLGDISLVLSARDAAGNRLSRIGFGPLTGWEDQFNRRDELSDFFTVGSNLLGLRPMPESDDSIRLSYVPYREVTSLDETIPVTDDYLLAVESLVISLMLVRLGHFERATEKLKTAIGALIDVRSRIVRP